MMLLALLGTAFGQEEVCDTIVTTHDFRSRIGEAEALVERGEIDRATRVLEKTYDLVRCMESLVDRSALADFADVYARVSFFSQEGDQAVRWGRLVELIEPDHDWGEVAEDHPLREMLAEAGPPPERSLEDQGYAIEKKGAVFIDARFSPAPAAHAEVPHLVQTFNAKGHLLSAYWQDGPAFPERMLGEPGERTLPKYYDASTGTITAKGKPPSDLPGREPLSPLVYAGAGLVATSAVLYGLAGVTHGKFTCDSQEKEGCPTSAAELTRLRSQTNLLVVGAGVTLVGGLGLGATGMLTSDGVRIGVRGRW